MVCLTFKTKTDEENGLEFSKINSKIDRYYISNFADYLTEALYNETVLSKYIGNEFKEKVFKKFKDVWLDFLQNELDVDPTKDVYDENSIKVNCGIYFNEDIVHSCVSVLNNAVICGERHVNNYKPDLYDDEFLRILRDASEGFLNDDEEIVEINECGFVRFYKHDIDLNLIRRIFYGLDDKGFDIAEESYLISLLKNNRKKVTLLFYKLILIFMFPEVFVEDMNASDVKYLTNFDQVKLNPMFIFDKDIIGDDAYHDRNRNDIALVVNPDQSGRHYDIKTLRFCNAQKFKTFSKHQESKIGGLIKTCVTITIFKKLLLNNGRLVYFGQIEKRFTPFLIGKLNERFKGKFFPTNNEFKFETYIDNQFTIQIIVDDYCYEIDWYPFIRSVIKEFGIVSDDYGLEINYNWVNNDNKLAEKMVKKLCEFLGFVRRDLLFNFSFLRTNEYNSRVVWKFYPYKIL